MKKCVFFAAALMLAACSQDANDEIVNSQLSTANSQEVTLTFSPYEVTQMSAPSRRAATNISNIVTHLDVWIYESGTEVVAVHQTDATAGFGTITATLDKTKTYTLYAVGHKADGATLTDGVIAFTDDKVTHAMYYSTTFSPGTTTNLNCEMSRIVAQFKFATTDQCPNTVTKMTFTINGVYDRWSVTSGASHQLNRTSTFENFTKHNDGTVEFNIFAVVTDAQTTHDVTVTAYDANDGVIQQRTFTDVPLRNGYKTTYRGTFFIDTPTTASFTINDWNSYETVDF
jgi:hypothetical protein